MWIMDNVICIDRVYNIFISVMDCFHYWQGAWQGRGGGRRNFHSPRALPGLHLPTKTSCRNSNHLTRLF